MSLNKVEKRLLLYSVLNSIVWILLGGVDVCGDSPTYTDAFGSLLNNRLDINRTPVYPIYLGILQYIIGSKFCEIATVIGQYFIYCISVIYFYRISIYFIQSPKVSFVLSLIYIFSPGLYGWNNAILTETFAITGMVFFLYCAIALFERTTLTNLTAFSFWAIFLNMLRPSFIYLIPLFGFFWFLVLFIKEKRKNAVCGLLGIICVTSLFVFYLVEYNKEYGVYSPSCVSYVNRYYIARQNGLIEANNASDPDIKKTIDTNIKERGLYCEDGLGIYNEAKEIISVYGLKKFGDLLDSSIKTHPSQYIKTLGLQIYKAGDYNILSGDSHVVHKLFNYMFGIHIHHVYLLLLLYLLFLLYIMIKKKEFPAISVLLFMVGFSNLFLVIVGAQGDWGRLNICVLPFYLLICGKLFEFFKFGNRVLR